MNPVEGLGPGWGKQIVTGEPQGPITDAPEPIPVRIRLALNNSDNVVVPAAWAMAWTSLQVLVFWRDPDTGVVRTLWLPAHRVRRRDSPIREE